MQAVILAAGQSRRLSLGKPKCLAEIGGRTLLCQQLESLRRFSIRDVCVVVGYRREDLIPQILRAGCSYRVNERFDQTNSLYSFSLALDWIHETFVLSNSDVLADPRIYNRLLGQSGNALAYDSSSGEDPEHMKVLLDPLGELTRVGKDLSCECISGENLGLIKIHENSLDELAASTMQELEQGGEGKWVTAAIGRLARTRPVHGVDVSDLPWVEIDFPEDLQRARSSVWAQIRAGDQPSTLNRVAVRGSY